MKRYLILSLILFASLGAFAQSIFVKSFQPLSMDMTASSLEGKRIDQNGDVAALIKVVTTETGFVFEGGTLGIVDTKQTPGEVWVWVPRAARKITIKHPKLGVLRDYYYPVEIEVERTYEMVLTTAKIETIIKEEVTKQYLIFELDPKNAILEVNDQLWSVDADGSALQFVDLGTYTYRVRAANYETDAGAVTVDDPDPDKPKIVKVKLKSNFAEVTLTVDADAEIWVNNEKKGTRTWTGSLGKGSYKIECKQGSHETSMVSKEITAEMDGQTITLPAPKPIYGSLNVESTPIGATIYIDGMEIGKTPRYINEVLIGQSTLRLVKEGYEEYFETFSVAKGERKQVKATLNKTQIKTVEIEIEDEDVVEQELFHIVEEMPAFPGGDAKLREYVATNTKYPKIARESGIQGRVFVGFIVEPDGGVSNVEVLRGIGGGCDEEAMRVVKSMPKWEPGKQRGKAVRVSYILPVYFRLQESPTKKE